MRGLAFIVRVTIGLYLSVATAGAAEVCADHPRADTGDIVTISGIFTVDSHWGPPNYGENPENDLIERHLMIVVDQPFSGSIERDNGDPEIVTLDKLQVVPGMVASETLFGMVGRRLALTATTFSSFTGHHNTRILLSVDAVREVAAPIRPSCIAG